MLSGIDDLHGLGEIKKGAKALRALLAKVESKYINNQK
jgi:hypothetical protein